MEKEIPQFPIHSNWKDMIYGEYEIEGLNDTEWTLTINRFKPGTITMLESDVVRTAILNMELR